MNGAYAGMDLFGARLSIQRHDERATLVVWGRCRKDEAVNYTVSAKDARVVALAIDPSLGSDLEEARHWKAEAERLALIARDGLDAARAEERAAVERELESGLVMLGLRPGGTTLLDLVGAVGRAMGERRVQGRRDGLREASSLLRAVEKGATTEELRASALRYAADCIDNAIRLSTTDTDAAPLTEDKASDFVAFLAAIRAAAKTYSNDGIVAARDLFLAQVSRSNSCHLMDPTHAYAAARIEGAIALLDDFVAATSIAPIRESGARIVRTHSTWSEILK